MCDDSGNKCEQPHLHVTYPRLFDLPEDRSRFVESNETRGYPSGTGDFRLNTLSRGREGCELQAIFQTCDTMAKIEEIHDEQDNVPRPKINNANLGELKATTDDAIAPVHPFPTEPPNNPK